MKLPGPGKGLLLGKMRKGTTPHANVTWAKSQGPANGLGRGSRGTSSLTHSSPPQARGAEFRRKGRLGTPPPSTVNGRTHHQVKPPPPYWGGCRKKMRVRSGRPPTRKPSPFLPFRRPSGPREKRGEGGGPAPLFPLTSGSAGGGPATPVGPASQRQKDRTASCFVIEDIKSLLLSFRTSKVSFCCRHANGVAHMLAS